MHANWPVNLTKTLLSPRAIVWVLIAAGVACFIYASPKTPVEFFDASARDQTAVQALKMEKNMRADRADTAASRLHGLMSCVQRMERIELLYDIANNPQRVNSMRSWIIDGGYSADDPTKAVLRGENETYRMTEQELERCRKDFLVDGPGQPNDETSDNATKDKLFEAAVFRMEMEASLLRQFQARLFWRNAR